MRLHALLPLSLFLAAACDAPDDTTERITLSPVEIDAVLELVNDPATDVATLDVEIGLERRAAQNIITTRNGADGKYPSSDDHTFDTLEELETVKYVGFTVMSILRDYVVDHPAPTGALVEGVEFTAIEKTAVLWGVNTSTLEELDNDVALARDTAESLVEYGPYESLEDLAAAPNVGAGTLKQLRAYAPRWQDIAALAGTFDGVPFEAHDAADALELANHATYEQLIAGGMYSSGAKAIIASRPYEDLTEVAAVNGVGPSTMQALKNL